MTRPATTPPTAANRMAQVPFIGIDVNGTVCQFSVVTANT
jgi:hypothetical protein